MFHHNNNTLERNEMPYINQQALPTHAVGPVDKKVSRSEKKALKKAKKEGTLIGGNYLAPVAPREEFFMGHPTINEVQKPGLATGYGIPENGRVGSPLAYGRSGSPYNNAYNGASLGGNQYTTGSTYTTGTQYTGAQCTDTHCTSGSPRVVYESAMPTTTSYAQDQCLGGTNYVQQQPMMQQHQPMMQQPLAHGQGVLPERHYAQPVQVQGYYDGMMLEQPHEKAGGFLAPFTGSLTNRGAGTTGGLQGQGKANFTNTIASALPGVGGAGYGNQGMPGMAGSPLLNAPNLTYPVALEAERMKGFASNKHIGLAPPGTKLSRKEKKAMKNGTYNNNPEYNNAAIY